MLCRNRCRRPGRRSLTGGRERHGRRQQRRHLQGHPRPAILPAPTRTHDRHYPHHPPTPAISACHLLPRLHPLPSLRPLCLRPAPPLRARTSDPTSPCPRSRLSVGGPYPLPSTLLVIGLRLHPASPKYPDITGQVAQARMWEPDPTPLLQEQPPSPTSTVDQLVRCSRPRLRPAARHSHYHLYRADLRAHAPRTRPSPAGTLAPPTSRRLRDPMLRRRRHHLPHRLRALPIDRQTGISMEATTRSPAAICRSVAVSIIPIEILSVAVAAGRADVP